jgi:hypothetical protein
LRTSRRERVALRPGGPLLFLFTYFILMELHMCQKVSFRSCALPIASHQFRLSPGVACVARGAWCRVWCAGMDTLCRLLSCGESSLFFCFFLILFNRCVFGDDAVLLTGLAPVPQDAGELGLRDRAPVIQGTLERTATGLDVGPQAASHSKGS